MYKKRMSSMSRFGVVSKAEVQALQTLKEQIPQKPADDASAADKDAYVVARDKFVQQVNQRVGQVVDDKVPEGMTKASYANILRGLLILVNEKNAILRRDGSPEDDGAEDKLRKIINKVEPELEPAGGFSDETLDNDEAINNLAAHETEETKKIKRFVIQVIQDGELVQHIFGETSNFPGEFHVLQNKSEWVQMLRTSANRETLFELLSNFVHFVSNHIAEIVGRKTILTTTDDDALSEEDMYQVENFISWHLLNQIMNKVELQINLAHFGSHIVKPGVIRPNTPVLPRTVKVVASEANFKLYVLKVCLKVFMVLAISSVLFTYVHNDSAQQTDFIKSIPEDFVVQHEITFFEGAQHVPVVTFLTPDVAERYESADPGHEHWTKLVEKASELTIKVHKFITPHLTGEFMHYFAFEGEEWSGIGDDETYEDEDEEAGEEY
jgi:hypothetical protein